jgi:hypothetical protein
VSEIAAGGTVSYAMAIDEQDESVVCADADPIAGRNRGQIQRATEVKNDGLAQRCLGMGDPGGGPVPLWRVRLDGGLSLQDDGGGGESEES